MHTGEAFKTELLSAIDEKLELVVARMGREHRDISELGDVGVLADRVIASIPRVSSSNLELGPFYTTASLNKWLEVTRQYVYELSRQRRILVLETSDRVKVYPAFQFGLRGALLPHLPAVLKILDEQLEPTTQAMWLITPQTDLDGLTPARWLRAGRDGKAVLASARRYMAKFDGDDEE
ncbi:hypothetical protein F1C58_16515 (plasmid) [Glaciihabitans sp. INWT7]|uniref:hypothetical protein n=1 Tax=Glaciihabitans sp. INWT7 TaxID=2596912 RepID=UPI00162A6E07|nr:hypothetical protein [Glaciihabitans sp. INWT7]QNE48660.1 hypothetical protein F1C58_16515 [Glaciihabitans sp. INWT7]